MGTRAIIFLVVCFQTIFFRIPISRGAGVCGMVWVWEHGECVRMGVDCIIFWTFFVDQFSKEIRTP